MEQKHSREEKELIDMMQGKGLLWTLRHLRDTKGINLTEGKSYLDKLKASAEYNKRVRFVEVATKHHKKLIEVLKEAVLQIEYMQEKLGETGTGNAILSRSRSLLHSLKTETE